MDENSSGQDIADAMGNILRSLGEAGYEVRRAPQPSGGAQDPLACFDELVSDARLQEVSGSLFRDRYFARSVEEAFKLLNNSVKEKSGLADRDGSDLMFAAFDADSPTLRLNDLETISEENEQNGYRFIYAGSMTGIRNPRAHEHDLADEPEVALELLVLANHLMRKLDAATKVSAETTE